MSGQEWTGVDKLGPVGRRSVGREANPKRVPLLLGRIGHCIARPPAITPLGCLSIAPNHGHNLIRVATVVWQRESLGLPTILSPARCEYTKDDSLPFATSTRGGFGPEAQSLRFHAATFAGCVCATSGTSWLFWSAWCILRNSWLVPRKSLRRRQPRPR